MGCLNYTTAPQDGTSVKWRCNSPTSLHTSVRVSTVTILGTVMSKNN
ncbi:MAG: hypothetical protein J6J37_05860 [Bacteroidaceae bacterium]|nr:hypothetical protein [Bacteroidaceae bacterium]